MKHTFTDPDLMELDKIWPLGQQLEVPDGGAIVVAGAYEGRYMRYLGEMFPTCRIVGYEPQEVKYRAARIAVAKNPMANVYNQAIGTASRTVSIGGAGTDGASVLSGSSISTEMRDVAEVVHNLGRVDLFVINLEGGEFSMIPYMLNELPHHKIMSMAVQFHPKYVSSNCSDRVIGLLDEYYNRIVFNFPDWTLWKLKLTCTTGLSKINE